MFIPPIIIPARHSLQSLLDQFDQKAAENRVEFDGKMARIAALHQQADTEHWHGQIFKRLEEA